MGCGTFQLLINLLLNQKELQKKHHFSKNHFCQQEFHKDGVGWICKKIDQEKLEIFLMQPRSAV